MTDQIFVSYSRDEIYYAEAVTQTLQEKDFRVWFDLEKLAPGAVWESEIEAGLKGSSSLVLIASKASLLSPYVAIEWMHALETDKPVHIVLFEEVEFKAFTTEYNDNTLAVPLDELQKKATTIIDGRGNFKKSMEELAESLVGTEHKDPVPTINRFNIPQRLPLPVAFVAGTMALLTALTLVLTFSIFSLSIPMMLTGVIATFYLGLQTWNFIQRKSYQATRVILAIAPVLAYLFAIWSTPIVIAALYFAFYSDDVHRWSPRGEGNNPRDLSQERQRPLWQKLLPFLFLLPLFFWRAEVLWLVLIIWFFVRNRNFYETHRRGETVVTLLILSSLLSLVDPILAIPLILWLTAMAVKRQRPIRKNAQTSNITYTIHAQLEDRSIAQDIEDALEYAGLQRLLSAPDAVAPDYQIVVISDFGHPPKIEELREKGGKIIVVVASSITDWQHVGSYADVQWVDYRKQEPERLIAMARDLKSGKKSNSFNLRIVPESFEHLVAPTRVLLFVLIQLFFYSISIFKMTRSIITGEDINLVMLVSSIVMLWISFWVAERVLNRRMTVLTMVKINIGAAFAHNILGILVAFTQPLPPGYERNTGGIFGLLVVNVIAVVIFYRIGKSQIEAILKWWLPPVDPTGKNPHNKQLTRAILLSGITVILITISFFGPNIPLSHKALASSQIHYKHVEAEPGIILDAPDHWLSIPTGTADEKINTYVLNTPFSAALMKANGPMNNNIAWGLNSYFQSPLAVKTLTIMALDALGETIGGIFDVIGFSISPQSAPWKPQNFGSPVYTLAYVPDGEVENILILTVWQFKSSISSLQSVVRNTNTAPNTQPVGQDIITPKITSFSSNMATFLLPDKPGKTVIVTSMEGGDTNFFVTISGPKQVLQANKAILEHVLESIDR